MRSWNGCFVICNKDTHTVNQARIRTIVLTFSGKVTHEYLLLIMGK
jgi:hypothetical protein